MKGWSTIDPIRRQAAARATAVIYLTWWLYQSGRARGRLDAYAEQSHSLLTGLGASIGARVEQRPSET